MLIEHGGVASYQVRHQGQWVAQAMAAHARREFGADWGIGLFRSDRTTVHICVESSHGGRIMRTVTLSRERRDLARLAATTALHVLRELLERHYS